MAKGAAWAVPAIVTAESAPAVAASSCATFVKGQPLPAAAFTATYIIDRNETLGRLANKQVAIDFGFRVTDAARACGVSGSITSVDGGGTSRFKLSNGTTYDGTNGLRVPANGTVGTTDTGCQAGLGQTEACGTTGQSPYGLAGSSSTSSYHVVASSIVRSITIPGYGTSVVYLNGSGFGATQNGSNFATSLSVTDTPLY